MCWYCEFAHFFERGCDCAGQCVWVWIGGDVLLLCFKFVNNYTNLGYEKILGLRRDKEGQK